MPIEGSSGHMGYEQAQARSALPTIAQSTADTHSESVTTNVYLKDVKSELNIQGRAIIQLAVSFKKFFEWNKEHATALMNSRALEDASTSTSTGSNISNNSKIDPKAQGPGLISLIKGLGTLPAILAVAIGTIGGLLIGTTKLIKDWARIFVPDIIAAFDDFKFKMKTSLDDFAKGVKDSFRAARNRFARKWTTMVDDMGRFFGSQFAKVKTFFSVADDGKMARLMTAINRRFKGFVDMLEDVRDLFKSLWQNTIGKIITKIKSGGKIIKNLMFKFNRFGRIVSSVAKLVGKLFLPLTVVMTAFDTIQGAIDGFEKDGWWGAIEGGITALFDSLIAMPLDLLLDGAEWIARKLGWNATADILGSFSFRKIFDDVIGEVFTQVRKLVDSLVNIFSIATDPEKTWWDVLFAGMEGIKNWYDLIFSPFNSILKWVMGKFVWDEVEAEKKNDFSFIDMISDLMLNAGEWLGEKVSKVWEDIKTWFTDFFVWGETETEKKDDFSFTDMVGDLALKGGEWLVEKVLKVWEDIKTWFTDSLESVSNMLPTWKEIKVKLKSMIPSSMSWMIPGPSEDGKDQTVKQQDRIEEFEAFDGSHYQLFLKEHRKDMGEIIAKLNVQLRETNQPTAIITNNNDNSKHIYNSSNSTAVSHQLGLGYSQSNPNPVSSGGGGW